MTIVVFAVACIVLLWALLTLMISTFFRGMAVASLGVELIHIAADKNYPMSLVLIGCSFILFPMATWFKHKIFGA